MVLFGDRTIEVPGFQSESSPAVIPTDWQIRTPSGSIRRWSFLHGLIRGVVWCFPFVMIALTIRRFAPPEDAGFWTNVMFFVALFLLIAQIAKGVIVPYTWWFAYTDRELLVERGFLFRRRNQIAFDRVQYLERRAGPIMHAMGLASLIFDTAAGNIAIPAATLQDAQTIEAQLRAAMERATVI